jgi:hypothetical protein
LKDAQFVETDRREDEMMNEERSKSTETHMDEEVAPHEALPDTVPGSDVSHPAGTALGGTGGAAAGGTLGALAGGPIGAAIGAIVGGVAGAYGGRVAAENLNPEDEDSYWRENYYKLDYIRPEDRYEDYAPAYRYGRDARIRYRDRSFEDVDAMLERDWETVKGDSRLAWDHARHAVRDAWERTGAS